MLRTKIFLLLPGCLMMIRKLSKTERIEKLLNWWFKYILSLIINKAAWLGLEKSIFSPTAYTEACCIRARCPALRLSDTKRSSCLLPPLSPRVALVIRDDRGGADAPALGAVPAVTLMVTVTTAAEAPPTSPQHILDTSASPRMPHGIYVVAWSIFHLCLPRLSGNYTSDRPDRRGSALGAFQIFSHF